MLGANYAAGIELTGTVNIRNSTYWLIQKDGSRIRLNGATQQITGALRQLRNQDYLIASGVLRTDLMLVHEIQFVGLKRILGWWIAADGSAVEIKDFNHIYWHQMDKKTKQLAPAYKIDYALAPYERQHWSLFMVRQGRPLTGRLKATAKKLDMEFWSSEKPHEPINLKRMAHK
ncbi:MAG: hypothetical protein AB7N80_10885 [Bdellovibrionales bacterium]